MERYAFLTSFASHVAAMLFAENTQLECGIMSTAAHHEDATLSPTRCGLMNEFAPSYGALVFSFLSSASFESCASLRRVQLLFAERSSRVVFILKCRVINASKTRSRSWIPQTEISVSTNRRKSRRCERWRAFRVSLSPVTLLLRLLEMSNAKFFIWQKYETYPVQSKRKRPTC